MKIDISVVREILIPLSDYPHITAQRSISDAISLLLRHNSGDGCHMHYEEILVTDDNGKLVGQLRSESILENFFRPALRPSASKVFFEDSEQFADLILIIDDWFKAECRSLTKVTVAKYMCRHPYSINASAHVVHALGMMLTGQRKVLPVTENNVLQGAIRMEDIFRILGNRALPCQHST